MIALISVAAMMLAMSAMPAMAAPVFTGGLINVTVTDVVEDVTVQVPVGVAANLCDINAAVLVAEFNDTGAADCTATAESKASNGPGKGGGAR
jgi:hypothetical protein